MAFAPLKPKEQSMNPKALRWFILLPLVLMAFSQAHKFYVSVTNVTYSKEEASIQIISRLFTDDLDNLLETRYGLKAQLNTPDESPQADAYIQRYFREKFELSIDGVPREYSFLGKRYENDLVICYIELADVGPAFESIALRSDILTDLFEEQKNLVHFDILGKKKSFVLIRENNKGMLNLP